MANLSGIGNHNLLPGKANIYYRGSSVGETYLNTKSTKNTMSIPSLHPLGYPALKSSLPLF